jgi:hypothetical protein
MGEKAIQRATPQKFSSALETLVVQVNHDRAVPAAA